MSEDGKDEGRAVRRESPLSPEMQLQILKFVGGIALVVSGALAGLTWYIASSVAERAAQDAATETARTVAKEVSADIARQTSTYIKATSVADTLMANEQFKSDIASGTMNSFKGAIAAFDVDCPEGWTNYSAAVGKFVIGAGSDGTLEPRRGGASAGAAVTLDDYALKDQGGEERHILSEGELPVHSHPLSTLQYVSVAVGGAETYPGLVEKGPDDKHGVASLTGLTGSGQPHNNLPPYLALNLCQKS